MIIIATIYLLILKLFLAGKDASSFLLKDKNISGELTDHRIKRWHRDGVAIDILSSIPIAYIFKNDWWQIAIISGLLRLSVYDLAFNKWSSLSLTYLGSTAWFDRLFIKLFGQEGAIKKSLFFVIILILFEYVFCRR